MTEAMSFTRIECLTDSTTTFTPFSESLLLLLRQKQE
jgi:hypothetical protein